MSIAATPVLAASGERPLLQALRDATRQAHTTLERRIDLMSAVGSQTRFERLLRRFETFHRDWEPKVEGLISQPPLLIPRRRLALLHADLTALDLAPDPGPGPDLSWLDNAGAAWGSLYVVEGSTLGGQVIAKALSNRTWLQSANIRYFGSRGRRTAAFWRETTEAITTYGRHHDQGQVLDGAARTFELLVDWLSPSAHS
jgi:heme oxygenase